MVSSLPKWVDVITCKSKHAKFQAIRWKHDDGTLTDIIYRWNTGNDIVIRESPATAETLALFVEHNGFEECAP